MPSEVEESPSLEIPQMRVDMVISNLLCTGVGQGFLSPAAQCCTSASRRAKQRGALGVTPVIPELLRELLQGTLRLDSRNEKNW